MNAMTYKPWTGFKGFTSVLCRGRSLRCYRLVNRCVNKSVGAFDSDAISDDDKVKLTKILESFKSFDRDGCEIIGID